MAAVTWWPADEPDQLEEVARRLAELDAELLYRYWVEWNRAGAPPRSALGDLPEIPGQVASRPRPGRRPR